MSDVKRYYLRAAIAIDNLGEKSATCDCRPDRCHELVYGNDYDALAAENARLREALTNLYAMVLGECPSILEDDHHSDMIRAALAPSVQPNEERT